MKERKIDQILNYRIQIGKLPMKVVDLLFILCLWVFSFSLRWKLMPIESADFWGFLQQWMEEIRATGGFRSLGHQISNYTSPYMYLMCIASYITTNDLYALKLISFVFDYSASVAVFLIVYEMTQRVRTSTVAMAILLICPTVVIDSAYWCQCDIIYTSWILWALLFFFRNDSKKCLIFIGIAFSFKLQTMFIIPFLIIMWLKKKTIRLRDFIYIPVIYVISVLPAWMMGRDFKELMLIYFDQSGYYPWGTLEYPNIYAIMDETIQANHHMYEICSAGTVMVIVMMGFMAYYLYTKEFRMTNELLITLALFLVAITVYGLPHMHDRYGFLIDLLAIIYGVINKNKLAVTCGFVLVSIVTFMPYLIAVNIVPLKYTAMGMLGLIVYVGHDLVMQIKSNTITLAER